MSRVSPTQASKIQINGFLSKGGILFDKTSNLTITPDIKKKFLFFFPVEGI